MMAWTETIEAAGCTTVWRWTATAVVSDGRRQWRLVWAAALNSGSDCSDCGRRRMTTVDGSRWWTAAASATMEMAADGGCEDH